MGGEGVCAFGVSLKFTQKKPLSAGEGFGGEACFTLP